MKLEKRTGQVNQADKSNAGELQYQEEIGKSETNKENNDANSLSKNKKNKDQKDKTSSAITEEIDFSKREMELQNYLTGNLNKILYNRNQIKRVSKFDENVFQISSIKDFEVVRKKVNKISNDESFIFSDNSKINPNLSFSYRKNSKKMSFNGFASRSDKAVSFENNVNSFKRKSKSNYMLKNDLENVPKINNFVGSFENRKGDEHENVYSVKDKFQQFNDVDIKSSKFSSNEVGFKNPSGLNSNININSNKFEKLTHSNKISDTANKGEIADLNANENDDLKRLQIFSFQQHRDSPKENFLDFGLNEKKEEPEADTPINFIRDKESRSTFKSPEKRNVNRKYSKSLHFSNKFSENNNSNNKNLSIFSPLSSNEKALQSAKLIRPLSHSKSLAVKNKIFDFGVKPSVNFKNSARGLNDVNAIKIRFDNNANNNPKVNPSFKNIADLMQFNKKAQIKSSKSIKNSVNLSKLMMPPGTEEAINAQNFNTELSDISDSDRELYRKLTHRNKVVDSHSDNDEIVIQNEQYTTEGFIFDLDSTFIGYWDLLITLITLYTLTYSPYKMAFPDVTNTPIEIIECFMDLIFIIDIVFQFFIPFYNYEEELIKTKSLIAINYLSGWFLIDLVASIPGSIITYFMVGINPQEDVLSLANMSTTSFENINKLTRLAKFYRVLKITKLSKVLKMSGDGSNKKRSNKLIVKEDIGLSSSVKRILNFSFVFMFATHMITCIWIFIGTLDYPNWLVKAKLADSSNFAIYISSLYFHWTTIFTIGYGDILSANTTERFYNIFLMFVGVLIYSFAVSALGTILSQDDKSAERFLKNIDLLYEMRVRYNIPVQFYEKVEKFLRYDFKNNKMEKFSFINDLPMRIKNELLLNMYKDVIKNFKFFKEKSIEFSTRVVFMMKPLRLTKNEYLIFEGEFIEEIVFVRSGYLTVNLGLKFNELKIMEIRPNEHFGDILVLLNLPSPIGLKVASKFADLIIIRKEDMMELSDLYSESIQKIFWISSYNYFAMLNRIEKKKQKFKLEEEKTIKKQMLYDKYLSLIEKKKKFNPLSITDCNRINSNQRGLVTKNFVSNNQFQIKRYQTELSLPYKEIISKSKLDEVNSTGKNNKIESNSYNIKLGNGLENSYKSDNNSNKNQNDNNQQFKSNNADNLSGFFKHKLQEKVSNQNNNEKAKNSISSDKYAPLANNYESKSPMDKLNRLIDSKNNSNKNSSNCDDKNYFLNSNYKNFESSNFNNINDIKESLSNLNSNKNNKENLKRISEFDKIGKKAENSYYAGQSISSNSKTDLLKKQSTLQLLSVDSSYNSLKYNKILNLNNNMIIKDDQNKEGSSVNQYRIKNGIYDDSIKNSRDNKNMNNNVSKPDLDNESQNCLKDSLINFKSNNSSKAENNDLDFSYNNFNPNDQSSLIGINNCKFNYSRKNSELLILKDDFNVNKSSGVEKLNININNIIRNSNLNTQEVSENCIFKSANNNNSNNNSNKKGNEIQNIQKINIVNKFSNNNNKVNDANSNNNYNNNNNLKLENEAFNNLNKINFSNLIHNIPQNIFHTNNSSGSNSGNSNNNSHNNYYLNNNNNLNLITLTTENSKILINTKQKSDAELNNNNINNTQNTNLLINSSFNFLENLNKSNEETINDKKKVEGSKNPLINSKKIVNPNANNIIYIDNLNINNNCNHIYESGGKKCGDAYCISNDSGSKNNFSRIEKKNKNINNVFTFKSRLKYKEDEISEKGIKDESTISLKKYEKNNFMLNPNFNVKAIDDYEIRSNSIDNKSNCSVRKEEENNEEKSKDSNINMKKFSVDLEVCNRESSFDKSSPDGVRKYSLKEKKMQMLNRLTNKVSRGSKLNKVKATKSKPTEKNGLETENLIDSNKKKLKAKRELNDSSTDSSKTINKISTKVKSKSISSPANNLNLAAAKEAKEGLIENKNLEILKNILNYREKEFKLKQKLSMKLNSSNDKNKLSRTNTINYSEKNDVNEQDKEAKGIKQSFSKKANNIVKSDEEFSQKKIKNAIKINNDKSKKLNGLLEIKEEDLCTYFDSGKKIKQTDFTLFSKLKIDNSRHYDHHEDLMPKDLKTERQRKSNLKNYRELKDLKESDLRRKTSNSFNVSKSIKNLSKKKSSDYFLSDAKGNMDDFLIESEEPLDSVKDRKTTKINKAQNHQASYLSNLNSANSELKRFLTLGIQQEYKLEAQKVNKIIVKILENNSKQDFFMLDKNKKFLEFKDYFVFNTNMINRVKKMQKKERKMDKIKIPFVEI